MLLQMPALWTSKLAESQHQLGHQPLTKPLSDNQVGDLLGEALNVIGEAKARTKRGDTTIRAARMALISLQMGLVLADEASGDVNESIIDPSKLRP